MPGFIERMVAICPGAVSSFSRSVKWTLVVSPVTGPNGAARLMFAVEKSPVEVTLPAPVQLILPCPRSTPLTSATTPSVTGVSSSGCRFGPKAIPGTSRLAWPAPLLRLCSTRALVTKVPLSGMAQAAGRGDPVVVHDEMDVVCAQRIEFGRVGSGR